MPHPEMELVTEYKKNLRTAMQPVYSSTEKLTNKGVTNRAVQKIMQNLFEDIGTNFEDTLSQDIID